MVESPTCLVLRKVSLFWIDNNKNQVIITFKRTTRLLILLSLRMLFAKAFQAWRPQQQAMTSCKWRLFVEADCESFLLLQNCSSNDF